MSAGLSEQRDDLSVGFIGAVVLHAAVGAALILFAPKAEPKLIINSVPVTIVSEIPDSAPDVGLPIPPPAELSPVETPPTPAPPPPPAPPKKATPTPPVAPKGTKPPKPKTPPKAASIDADRMLEELSNDTKLKAKNRPNTSPTPPPRVDNAKTGSQNRGQLSTTGKIAWAGLQRQLADNWDINFLCQAANLDRLVVRIRFKLSSGGGLLEGPTVVNNAPGGDWREAARLAQAAVRKGAPFRDLPAELLNRTLEMDFKAKQACG